MRSGARRSYRRPKQFMPRDEAVLVDMIAAGERAQSFVVGMDRAAFLADLKTQSAVLHQLLVLGEAVKRLSESFRAAHPDVPWNLVAGMRDKLIHHYDAVDLHEVWNTIDRDVAELLKQLRSVK